MLIVERLINELSKLPGIGRKSATRLAFHLLNQSLDDLTDLSKAIIEVPMNIKECDICHNFMDKKDKVCSICSDNKRNKEKVVVVSTVQDLMAIEEVGHYRGQYHVLHGLISPLKGIGIDDIRLESLVERVKSNAEIKEIIFALTPNTDGETTSIYLKNSIQKVNNSIQITQIAKGVPIGSEIEYVDKMTLMKAIENRT